MSIGKHCNSLSALIVLRAKNSELQTPGDCHDNKSCPGRFGFCGFHGNFVLVCYRNLALALSGLNHDARIQEELCVEEKRF
jgi:hypothetical protein